MDSHTITEIYTHLINLFQSYFERLQNITLLAKLEAILAGKTLVKIIILGLLMGILTISTWLSFLLFIYTVLRTWQYTSVCSAFVVLLINLFAMSLIYIVMQRLRKYLFFPATRQHIGQINLIGEGDQA